MSASPLAADVARTYVLTGRGDGRVAVLPIWLVACSAPGRRLLRPRTSLWGLGFMAEAVTEVVRWGLACEEAPGWRGVRHGESWFRARHGKAGMVVRRGVPAVVSTNTIGEPRDCFITCYR